MMRRVSVLAVPCRSARAVHTDAFLKDVAAHPSTTAFFGGPVAAVTATFGTAAFLLTYGYNIAVPVMEAYAGASDDGGD
jgi:hypothetical protein